MFFSEQRLIEKCIEKDERAWEKFIELFSGLLFFSAKQRLARDGFIFSLDDLEEIVQIVFTEIWEKNSLKRLRSRKSIKAWLSVTAQTRALNYMRRKKERLLNEDEFFLIDRLECPPSADYESTEFTDLLEKTIGDFDLRDRLVFKLNIVHGMKHREIGKFMGIPVNTVSSIIARKKKYIRNNAVI